MTRSPCADSPCRALGICGPTLSAGSPLICSGPSTARTRSFAATSWRAASGRRPGRVRDRYLVGMLAPKGTVAADPERDDDVGPEEGDDTGGGVQDGRIPEDGHGPVVDGGCPWSSTARSTGWSPAAGGVRYLREFEDQDDGSRAAVWVRHPQEVGIVVPLADGEFGPLPVNGEGVCAAGSCEPARRWGRGW